METNGIASGSDNEGPKVANSDSEEEAPNHSDSEPEAPRPADSDAEESPVKGRISTSDVEGSPGPERRGSISDIEGSSVKRRGSTSDTEGSPVNRRSSPSDVDGHATSNRGGSHSDVEGSPLTKHKDSNSDVEGYPVKCRGSASDIEGSPFNHRGSPSDLDGSPTPKRTGSTSDIEESPVKHRGSSSDLEEEKPKMAAANSDSDNEDRPPSPAQKRHSNAHSDSETEIPKNKEPRELGGEKAEKKGKWKAVMHSDSDDDMKARPTKAAPSSDPEDVPAKRVVDDSEDDDEMPSNCFLIIQRFNGGNAINLSGIKLLCYFSSATKKSRAVSDDDNSDSEAGSDAPDKTMAKLRELGSDSEDEDARTKAEGGKKDEKTLFGSDSESGDEEDLNLLLLLCQQLKFLFLLQQGFNQEDLEGDKGHSKALEKKEVADDSDSDEGVDRGGGQDFMSDFDVMLARKKAQSGKRRRNRDGGTFISDADDVVSAMITKMTEAAEEDRTLNAQKKPALKKLTLLPTVVMHLKKQDLKETFIDSGVMTAIKEWIGPLPDKSLPALKIREELLKILQELPSVSQETLKHSGIGRAVMFLYKHPKESRPNKDLALKLINEWSRPIFGLTSNYKGMTREERQQRDLDQQMPQKRRLSSGGQTPRRDLEKVLTGEEKALRPGDPGFCARARVPMPSNKDYVVRPKWNVESESRSAPVKKGVSRVDKQLRRFADIKRMTKTGHAVKISVQGNRMPL
uniref:TFIIS N-terminal domain-containing protein n=1 Tax=Esox lucius TaxID=8010 RepID=A0A6Q2YZP5_ESOLU